MNGWALRFQGYEPAEERRREALCTLGNGVFASRAAAPETAADALHYPGTYAAGVYNRLADDVEGVHLENESIVNLPNWLSLQLGTGDAWFHPDSTTHAVSDFEQWLDLRHGILHRSFRLRDRADRTTRFEEQRFVHMAIPHLCALRTTITAENWSGEVTVRSGLDGDVSNSGVDRYARLSGDHLEILRTGTDEPTVSILAQTSQSRLRVAMAARTRLERAGQRVEPGSRTLQTTTRSVHEKLTVDVAAGSPVTVEKIVALYTSRDPALSEPLEAARAAAQDSPGFDDCLTSHRIAWDALWRVFGIDLEEPSDLPDDLLSNVRLGLFHLLQTVSPHTCDLDAGLPARGLSGEAYRGHVFWDEMLVIPQLAARLPGLARSLILYRYRRLGPARAAARELGCRGACFPWQSGSDGHEQSQRMHLNPSSGHWLPDVTHLQRHVSLAVALSAWRYVETTGDLEFLSEYAADLILETTMFFADLARFDVRRGRFVIEGVVGPDEFHTGYPGRPETGIDNNAYTNILTAWLAHTAIEVLSTLPHVQRRNLTDRLGVTAADVAAWTRLSTQMFVPFHDGVISQFEGYENLEELDWGDLAMRYRDIRRLDRLLEAEGRSVNSYKASKQADVLMLQYVLTLDELHEVLQRLGYRLDRTTVPATIDYYLERTCHGSTLSNLVHAWVLSRTRRDRALDFLLEVVHSDVGELQGGTTAEGIHLAAMVGGADLLQRCYAGVEPRLDGLTVDPAWPREFGTLRTHLRYQGHEIDLQVGTDFVHLRSDAGSASPVTVHCKGTFSLHAGQDLHLPRGTDAGMTTAGRPMPAAASAREAGR